ncbi:MAG: hypothetical protein KGM44_11735 [bacterium]|nr:hypothetical protein [bacterium]
MNARIPALLALACALALGTAVQARATEADCSSAALTSMLQHDQSMAQETKMSGDAEHDAMTMMVAHERALADLAKFEMLCGKSEKVKGAAEQVYQSSTGQEKELRLLLQGG